MDVYTFFGIEDIRDIIFSLLGGKLKYVRLVSTYFNELFRKYIKNKCQNIVHSVDPTKLTFLNAIYDFHRVVLIAQYVFAMVYLDGDNKDISTFYVNHTIYKIIDKIYWWDYIRKDQKIKKLKKEIKENNKKQVKGSKYTNNDNVYRLEQIKKCGLHNGEIAKEGFKNKKLIKDNFKLLLVETNPNFGILKLASVLEDANILNLRNLHDKEVAKECNELYKYIGRGCDKGCKEILFKLQEELRNGKYYKCPPNCTKSTGHTQSCQLEKKYIETKFGVCKIICQIIKLQGELLTTNIK